MRLIAEATVDSSAAAARELLSLAEGVHADPLMAIAAQGLDYEDARDRADAVLILADLAERARFAEAAVVLAMLPHSTPDGDQAKWIAMAETIWPDSTRDVKRYPKRTIAFGWFYLANLLAAREAIAD